MSRPGQPGDWPALVLEGVEIRRLDLTLRRPVGTATGTHHERPVLVVRVVAGGAEGWGECGALADGTPVDPSVAQVWPHLVQGAERLASAAQARHGTLPEPSVVTRVVGGGPAERLAGAALEMAVLDLVLQRSGEALGPWLGATRAEVPTGAVVGLAGAGPGQAVDRVAEALGGGARRVRLKIAPGLDVDVVAAVREAFADLALQVDANGSFRLHPAGGLDDARRLAELDRFDLVCLEQPLPAADLAGHAELAALVGTPIALDESLSTPRRVAEALRYGACSVACLKPSRLGGLLAARRAVVACREAGVGAFIGGFFETGLGRSANLAVASLDGVTLPGDLSAPSSYLEGDPFDYPEPVAGMVPVPTVPGVAGRPDRDALRRATGALTWVPGSP
jgi:O-succinylbenzoate synthase